MRRSIAFSFILALGATALATTGALAQTVQTVVRDQVIVTAALEEETERELPASVEVIDADEIEARQVTSVSELLATAAGLHVVRLGSPGQVTSLFTRGTESDHTLVLWNGIELNNPYFGGFDFAFLPVEGVDRIEVVRGPFSALHGSDAMGGAVQIVRSREPGGAVRIEGGERGYLRGALSAAAEFGATRFDVAASGRRGDGLLENDDYRSDQLVAALEWDLGGDSQIGILARINEAEVGIARSSGVPSPNRRIDWRETQIAVPYRRDLGKWRLEAQWSSVLLDSAFRDPDDAFGFTRSDTRSEAARLRSQASYRFASGSWLAVGVEAERLTVDDSSTFGINLENARQETRSVFAQSFRRFSSFTLDLGARYDDSDVYGSRLTPRIGVLVPLSQQVSVRASYGEGFRAPSLGELFFQFSGNAELAPEESESFEVGLEYASDRWELELVGFDNRLVNLIDFDFSTFTNVNVGRARTRGLEIRSSFQGGQYGVRGNVTLLEATDEIRDLPLLRRPEQRASLVVTRRQAKSVASATAVYVGPSDDVDPVSFGRARNDGYVRVDFAGEWRGGGRLRPYARVENAFDEQYEEALGFPASPRSWVGGLSMRWQ